jgi:hypothetical protein
MTGQVTVQQLIAPMAVSTLHFSSLVFRQISGTIWESIGWATNPAKKQKQRETM